MVLPDPGRAVSVHGELDERGALEDVDDDVEEMQAVAVLGLRVLVDPSRELDRLAGGRASGEDVERLELAEERDGVDEGEDGQQRAVVREHARDGEPVGGALGGPGDVAVVEVVERAGDGELEVRGDVERGEEGLGVVRVVFERGLAERGREGQWGIHGDDGRAVLEHRELFEARVEGEEVGEVDDGERENETVGEL